MNFLSAPDNDAGRKIIFVTGTDTGVGKTLMAGLLLHHLRLSGCRALAMKPFSCGGTEDVNFLRSLQDGELQPDEVSPFYFPEPAAPAVAAQMHRRTIRITDALRSIRAVAARCDRLIIEGCGGLLVPLGRDFTVADLIERLGCRVVVVSRNRLGTINHTLLTVGALRTRGLERIHVALMEGSKRDLSSRSNCKLLAQWLSPVSVVCLPFLGRNSCSASGVKRNSKKVKKTLAQLLNAGNVAPSFASRG